MSEAIERHGSAALATTAPTGEMTREQIDLLKRTLAAGVSDDEFALFLATCRRLRLDPFARQIFAVSRWDGKQKREVMTTQVSIDGLRLVAERSGAYQGQTPVQWCGEDGVWVDVWLDRENHPSAARVGVHRAGFAEPLYRVARFRSYAQTTKTGDLNRMWEKMSDVMIAKCAEALALRAAFPHDLSGVYTREEMGQADSDGPRYSHVEVERPKASGEPAPEADVVDGEQACNAPSPEEKREPLSLPGCRTPALLEGWCQEHGAAVIRKGMLDRVYKQGAEINVLPAAIDAWCGVEVTS